MKKIRDLRTLIFLSVTVLLVVSVLTTSYLTQDTQTRTNTEAFAGDADISLESYCKDGYYNIPGEDICSRAPNCGGKGYDDVASLPQPNPQKCMGDGDAQRGTAGCGGYVPVCCYEMARTGDFTKCVGYWERLWCAQSLCDQARSRGANDSQCGGSCQCAHASNHYCGGNAPVIPLAQRLGISNPPTNTPIPQPPTNTPRPPTTAPTAASPRPTITPTATPRITSPTAFPTVGAGTVVPTVPPSTNSAATWTPVPTWTPAPTWTGTPGEPYNPQPTRGTPFSLPFFGQREAVDPSDPEQVSNTIEIKSPKELAREVVNPESIQKLNQATEKPLTKAKEGFYTVKGYDQKLENYVEEWVFKLRIWIGQVVR